MSSWNVASLGQHVGPSFVCCSHLVGTFFVSCFNLSLCSILPDSFFSFGSRLFFILGAGFGFCWSSVQKRRKLSRHETPNSVKTKCNVCVTALCEHSKCDHSMWALYVWPLHGSTLCVTTLCEHSMCDHSMSAVCVWALYAWPLYVWPLYVSTICVSTLCVTTLCGHSMCDDSMGAPYVWALYVSTCVSTMCATGFREGLSLQYASGPIKFNIRDIRA